jgi:adenylate cyclase
MRLPFKRPHAVKSKGHRIALAIGVVMTLLVLILWVMDAFVSSELGMLNWRFRLRGAKPITAPAVIVAIDDESLNGWVDGKGDYQSMPERWTWPRTVYGKLVDHLSEAGAKIIVFDMVFSESTKGDPKQDAVFAAACKKAGNVVFGIRYSDIIDPRFKSRKLETLIPGLADAASDSGVVHALLDADNFMRQVPMTDAIDLERPNLDLAVYRQLVFGARQPFMMMEDRSSIQLGDNRIPLERGHVLQVNFAGGAKSFPTIPFHQAFYKDVPGGMGIFKDKVVYVGSTTEILHDNFPTPFKPNVKMPGVEIHAHALDTLVSRDYIKTLPPWAELLLVVGLGIGISFLIFRIKPWQGMLWVVIFEGTYLGVSLLAFMQARWVLPMIAPMTSAFVSFAGIIAWRLVVEERKARDIRNQFSRYVSRSIVDEILKDPSKISLGGQVKEVTILFSDVRGFTAMSETMDAEAVVSILNEYLTAMVDIVIANEGTLDKYVGDAVMAVWGSPLPDARHCAKAVTCAVQMMERLELLQQKWRSEGKPPIDIGIGLNSGHVIAGNMGHLHYKMDYTVIGDDVNLAARLESANKELHSHVLISASTYEGSSDLVEVFTHPPLKVKGKEKPVEVFEVIGWKGQARASWAKPLQK